MMWERCRDLVEAQGCKVVMNTRAVGVRHEDGRAVAVIAETRRRGTRGVPVRPRHLVDAHLAALDGHGAGGGETRRGAPPRTCATGTFSPSPWWSRSNTAFPTTGSTCTHTMSRSVGSRTSGHGRPTWSRRAARAWASSSSSSRATRRGPESDADLIEQGTRELAILGLVDPSKVEAGLRRAHAEGLSLLRRALQGQRGQDRRVVGGLHSERSPRRTKRDAPVQQSGPLDVHRHAHGREHRTGDAPRRLERERRGVVPRGVINRRHQRRARTHGAPAATPR